MEKNGKRNLSEYEGSKGKLLIKEENYGKKS